LKRASSTISISLTTLIFLLCAHGGIAAGQKSVGKDKTDCQAKPACAALLAQGIKDYQQRLYEPARASFEKALTMSSDPRLLVLLGRTHFKQQDPRGALELYEQAQSQPMSAVDRGKLEQYVVEAREAALAAETRAKQQALAAQAPPPPPPPPKEEKKLKPWMWALIGVASVAVVGTAIGVGVYYGTGTPTPDFTVRFP
jgi:tetratricopeptide (TPR) repeat protein